MEFDFTKRFGKKKLTQFAQIMKSMSAKIGFKVSARGWCYLMEQAGFINKSQFDKVESAVNRCRKSGLLPVNFVAEEDARMFLGVEKPTVGTVKDVLKSMCEDVLHGDRYFTPEWWEGEEYYIQVLVEKIDLRTLFLPVCSEYHIPIANSKGWSSILQRAEYARRFKLAEQAGLKCVLLYAGDHDPDGIRISDRIKKNLEQVSKVHWDDGVAGYNPSNLIVDRFGLNYDFIQKNGYTWIDNLITGSGKDLSKPSHPNHNLPYLQNYIKKIGVRKCEANAIVTTPEKARDLMRDSIEKYLGNDATARFQIKRDKVREAYVEVLEQSGLSEIIDDFLDE